MTNFSKKELRKYIIGSIISLLVFCFLVIIIANAIPAIKIYKTSKSIKTDLDTFQTQISKKDFKNSLVTAQKLQKESRELRNNVGDLKLLNSISAIGDNIDSVDNLSEILTLAMNSYIEFYPILDKNSSLFSSEDKSKILSLPKTEKANIIKSLSDSQEAMSDIEKNVTKIINLVDKNKDNKNIVKPLKDVWNKIDVQYDNIKIFQRFLPVVKALPELLGASSDAKYLLLFQNNTELRPTGGFIGTYGTVKISNGEIGDIFTDNTYNLDGSSKIKIDPPAPLKQYLKIKNYYMRDSNFNPDYKITAEYIENIYKQESKDKDNIVGVIAITPDVLSSIIGYFGEVTAMGLTFNKDNSTDLLNYETKFGYWQDKNVDPSKRKIIVQKLADVIFEKIKALSLNQLKDLGSTIVESLNEKQMLLYFNNKDAENFAIANNWAGTFADSTNSDFFAVVDTNVLSGKAEPYIDKNLDYELKVDGEDWIATLSLTYTQRYDDYLKNDIYQDDPGYMQEYKSYTRIYVPSGSWLVSLQKNGGTATRNGVDFSDENGKSSFGFYLTIPKNTTTTYKLVYKLPKELVNKMKNNYSLIYQKQAGLHTNKLNVSINVNKPIKSYSVNDDTGLTINSYNKIFTLNGNVNKDKIINLKFYSGFSLGIQQ